MSSAPPVVRVRVRVSGTVQGVGFRPYVHRLAGELGLAGFVLNDERGVLIEAEGAAADVERLLARLPAEAPPLARVERVRHAAIALLGGRGFAIVASAPAGEPLALVSPDVATCDACLAELFDARDRRFRYPFVNCTNCGPRFTIVRGVPYDRPLTTMAGFAMCAECRAEYADPADRRFHAQPNACPACGPRSRLVRADGTVVDAADAVAAAAAALRDGAIVAVKGLGGFHLACLASDEAAVAALRARKRREERPFALMARDVAAVEALSVLDDASRAALAGRERPIVLVPRRAGAAVASSVAPRSADLGVMLPYTPLHHLLLADAGASLVMTSGNVTDEPIAFRDEDALARLRDIADLFLVHDRPIHTRVDDSVVRALGGRRPLMLRRSRGFVPDALGLPLDAPRPVLACGAELKSTFCVAKGARAWVSHHIGDLSNVETLASFAEGVDHFERLFGVAPEVVAHDLHPDYLSTAYALALEDVEHVAVQHHHAHLAACLAEHGERGPAVGAIFDGTGYGADGTVWGGELLVGDLAAFERVAHLWPVRLPGGERAIRQPWRMACAWLAEAGAADRPPALLGAVDEAAWRRVAALARSGVASPVTSSVGRLFDAVAALCGVRAEVTYEGQAAIELEAAAARAPGERGRYEMSGLDARGLVLEVARDAVAGVDVAVVAARFHNGLADATARACAGAAARAGLETVVLSGGVFANRLLLERTTEALRRAGLRVLTPERLPPGDGGISYGQAAVAVARIAER